MLCMKGWMSYFGAQLIPETKRFILRNTRTHAVPQFPSCADFVFATKFGTTILAYGHLNRRNHITYAQLINRILRRVGQHFVRGMHTKGHDNEAYSEET